MDFAVGLQAEDSIRENEWIGEAACATSSHELFFSDELVDISAAKRICMTCPIMGACLEGAMRREEPIGVWGGQLFRDGEIRMTKRGRGRPRRVPRPEDDILTVPVPLHLEPYLKIAS